MPPSPPRDVSPTTVVTRAFETLGVSLAHTDAAEAEAAAWHENPGLDDPALEDLTALPFVTIDNPGSRDLDQALLIERDGADFRIRYALADASHYVRPGSALFASALERGASHYTPLAVAPMLPRSLSEDLVSLAPAAERRSVVFDMRLGPDGRALGTRVLRARIRSRAQLTYVGVQAFLDGRPEAATRAPGEPPDEPRHGSLDEGSRQSLRLLREVGGKLEHLARERGVIAFDRRETRIEIDGDPPRFVARERERLRVEGWNAEISLLCNTEGAALLAGLDSPQSESPADGNDERAGSESDTGTLEPIYRVHEAPPGTRLDELRRELDAWVTSTGLDERWRWTKKRSLADYIASLPDAPRERGRVRAVQRQVLVRQRASEFRATPGRHHALALASYARFSSPMREIVGVFTHRELLAELEGRGDHDPALRDAVIESANAARRRQKALDKRIGLAVIGDLLEADLARDPVPTRAGTVLGVRSGRDGAGGHLYVGLDEFALDLKVYAEDLERRHGTPYSLAGLRAVPADSARPQFAIGDAVGVRAAGFDPETERFRLDAMPRGEAARRERRRTQRRERRRARPG